MQINYEQKIAFMAFVKKFELIDDTDNETIFREHNMQTSNYIVGLISNDYKEGNQSDDILHIYYLKRMIKFLDLKITKQAEEFDIADWQELLDKCRAYKPKTLMQRIRFKIRNNSSLNKFFYGSLIFLMGMVCLSAIVTIAFFFPPILAIILISISILLVYGLFSYIDEFISDEKPSMQKALMNPDMGNINPKNSTNIQPDEISQSFIKANVEEDINDQLLNCEDDNEALNTLVDFLEINDIPHDLDKSAPLNTNIQKIFDASDGYKRDTLTSRHDNNSYRQMMIEYKDSLIKLVGKSSFS